MMKSKLLAAAMISMTLTGASKATPITYAVSLFDGTPGINMGVGGSITTDGTLGTLTASNILDWDLIGTVLQTPCLISGCNTLFNLTGPLSGNNSTLVEALNIVAAPLTLTLGFGADLNFADPVPHAIVFAKATTGGTVLIVPGFLLPPHHISYRDPIEWYLRGRQGGTSRRSWPNCRGGTSRPDLGLRWPSRLVATAAKDRLSFKRNLYMSFAAVAIAEQSRFMSTCPRKLTGWRNGASCWQWPLRRPLRRRRGGLFFLADHRGDVRLRLSAARARQVRQTALVFGRSPSAA